MKGCISSWLTSGWFEEPATDHSWCAKAPISHGFGITSATAAGPMLNLPEPSAVAVAVGKSKVGPTPQIRPVALAGEKKARCAVCGRSRGRDRAARFVKGVGCRPGVRGRPGGGGVRKPPKKEPAGGREEVAGY